VSRKAYLSSQGRQALASCGTAEQAAENAGFENKASHLKPYSLHSSYVRPDGRTLQRIELFRSL
jgi:hypothetical protein